MHLLRASEPLRLWLSCALMALSLLVLPIGSGRGMLPLLLDGPCGADCPCDGDDASERGDDERATLASTEHGPADHASVSDGDGDACPPDCADCHCCATPVVAFAEHAHASALILDASGVDVRGPPASLATGTRSGVYRPPRS